MLNYSRIKRLLDLCVACVALIGLSPVMVIVGSLIKLSSSGPVLFRQSRVGQNGVPFTILKFRTMRMDSIGLQITSEHDERITKVGRLLRKSKLDELPQLINVLKGEMSLVGPRPEVQKYVNLYTERQRLVLELKPGITDYASVLFRNESSVIQLSEEPEKFYIDEIMPRKLELNILYHNDISLWTDFKIILFTIAKVVFPNIECVGLVNLGHEARYTISKK